MNTNNKTSFFRTVLTYIALIASQAYAIMFSIQNILYYNGGYVFDEVGNVFIDEMIYNAAYTQIMNIGLISLTLSFVTRTYNHYMSDEEYTFYTFVLDVFEAIKVAMISIVLSTGVEGILLISLLLLFEKFDETKLGEMVADYPTLLQYFIAIMQLVSIPFVLILSYLTMTFSTLNIYSLLVSLVPVIGDLYVSALLPLVELGFWGVWLSFIIGFTYMCGYTLRDLWFVGKQDNDNDDEPLFTMDKFKSLMNGYFVSTPSFILSSIFLILAISASSVSSPIAYWLSQWTFDYSIFVFASVLLYTVQPLVEELIFRSLGVYYMISAEYLPKDISETTFTGIILAACLNGWLFAVAHQHVYALITIPGYISLFMGGAAYTVMVLTEYNVSVPSFFHTMHNFTIQVYKFPFILGSFVNLIAKVNLSSIIAESVRVYWVSGDTLNAKFESDYQKASNFISENVSQIKATVNELHSKTRSHLPTLSFSWMF